MKRPSYKFAVELIALNDGPGDSGARDLEYVSHMFSVVLVADLFGLPYEKVAKDVIRVRERLDGKRPPGRIPGQGKNKQKLFAPL